MPPVSNQPITRPSDVTYQQTSQPLAPQTPPVSQPANHNAPPTRVWPWITESLRLYSVVPVVTRICEEDDDLGRGGVENKHPTDVESTNNRIGPFAKVRVIAHTLASGLVGHHEPRLRVFIGIHPQSKSCSELGSVLVLDDPTHRGNADTRGDLCDPVLARQGLPLVHFSPQPELFLSMKPPNVSPKCGHVKSKVG